MSKRPRAAVRTKAGKQQAAASEPVEVISLLEDSSPPEEDSDDFAVQHAVPPTATGVVMRPTKRLRRMDWGPPTQQQQPRPQRSAVLDLDSAGQSHASASVLSGSRCWQLAVDPLTSQAIAGKALRQGTLPVSSMPPKTMALPFQPLNISRCCATGAAAPTASIDKALALVPPAAGGDGGSPGPSNSPSLSQRSARGSPDPDYAPASTFQSPSKGSSQPTASQRHTRRQQQQRTRLQLRQLTFAPARTSSSDAAAAYNHGTPFPTTETVAVANSLGGTAAHGGRAVKQPALQTLAPSFFSSLPSGSAPLSHTSLTVDLAAEMWHERHAPHNEEDLVQVLHRKKVLEVKEWLEHQRTLIIQGFSKVAAVPSQRQCYPYDILQDQQTQIQDGAPRRLQQANQAWPGGGGFGSSGLGSGQGLQFRPPCGLAVLSGPSGCGKSACVKVLAEAMGFGVVEWMPPAPVIWNEHQYQHPTGSTDDGSGPPVSYQSKLDEFESFVSRSKYPPLALAASLTVQSASMRIDVGQVPVPGASQAIASAATRGSSAPASRPKLLLIEDLPHTHDAERRQRLVAALRDLAATARCPLVLVATEEGKAGSSGRSGPGVGGTLGSSKGLQKEILVALQSAGATTISFNPVTSNNIAKLLMRVAAAEGLELSPPAAVGLAEAADGDVRSALQALQMNAMLQKAALRVADAHVKDTKASRRGNGSRKRDGGGKKGGASMVTLLRVGRQQALTPGEVARLVAAQRDLGLPLFHALGKFLYNKRGGGGTLVAQGIDGDSNEDDDDVTTAAAASGGKDKKDSVALQQLNSYSLAAGRQWKLKHPVQLPARLLRPPMRYDPEAILLRCGLEAPVLLSFLHENYPSFVDRETQDAIDDISTVTAYLSDSAVLCGESRASATAATAGGGTSLWLEDSPAAANLSSAIAGSVATRGLMFGNTSPAPHCFNPIRAPASSAINQAAAANRLQLHAAACRLSVASGGAGGDAAAFGTSWDGSGTSDGNAGTSALFGGGSASQLVSTVMPWLRSLVQMSPQHATWLAPLLPSVWSYYWNGAVTEGAFLRHVASLPPPPYQQHHQWQQANSARWGGAGRAAGTAVSTFRCQPGVNGSGGCNSGDGAMESMLEQMGLEDEDPIEG